MTWVGCTGSVRSSPRPTSPCSTRPWEGRTLGLMVATAARGLRAGFDPPRHRADRPRHLPGVELLRAVGPRRRGPGRGRRQPHARRDRRAGRVGWRRAGALRGHRPRSRGRGARLPRRAAGARRASPSPARFAVGDRVTVARMAPDGAPSLPALRAGRHRRGRPRPGRVAAAGGGGRRRGDLHRALRHARPVGRRRRARATCSSTCGSGTCRDRGRAPPRPSRRRSSGGWPRSNRCSSSAG